MPADAVAVPLVAVPHVPPRARTSGRSGSGGLASQGTPANRAPEAWRESGSSIPSKPGITVGQSQSRMNDTELIREAQQGNHAAFEDLVRQYDSAVLRLAYHLTRSEQDAQDI